MSRRTLSTIGSALVVVVVALVVAWTQNGSDDSDEGSTPAGGSSSQAAAPPSYEPGPSGGSTTHGNDATDPASGLPWIAVADLPPEARHTLDLIDAGGPYPYPEHDDQTFGNYEGILPDEPRGYYKEYTVETPGSSDRGARRIIAGKGGELYYTDDHYASFSRIDR